MAYLLRSVRGSLLGTRQTSAALATCRTCFTLGSSPSLENSDSISGYLNENKKYDVKYSKVWSSHNFSGVRGYAVPAADPDSDELERRKLVRNIGISAHIDSGKTTLTERILFYTGRIHEIHEVRGKDGVGAKMDSMELEREKGITIQSAATYCKWKDTNINIIDTPGHVDFTIEVERALRVLDGAILVLCSVGGVQSQSITVDRQMRRYNVPRLAFINKCDRTGADPWKVLGQLREKLRLNAAAMQIPIGLEEKHAGVVDLVKMEALYFEGPSGTEIRVTSIPEELMEQAEAKREELVEKARARHVKPFIASVVPPRITCSISGGSSVEDQDAMQQDGQVADVNDEMAMMFLEGERPDADTLSAAIREATVANLFVPVFMGSAFKNRGVQALLDNVTTYLPAPLEVTNTALEIMPEEEIPFNIGGSSKGAMVGLAFKLEEGRYGQLTYLRLYQGQLSKGDTIYNTTTGKKVKVPRLIRMHSDEMEDIQTAESGDIVALFGVDCATGDTFTDGSIKVSMTSMNVPDAVMSLACAPKHKETASAFSKALNKFQKEDPTFRVSLDPESAQTIISGMGELHLEIYVERMAREYRVECEVGRPRVSFRERINKRVDFDYLHKKQSGGQGQYGRVTGYIEPIEDGSKVKFEFLNHLSGNNVPPGYVPAIKKGFEEAVNAGNLIGFPVEGTRVVLEDGAAHAVDSSEVAFKLASIIQESNPSILEPVMTVTITTPIEFQGTVMGDLNKRKGMIENSEQEMDDAIITCLVPLNNMFGYSTDLRSMTQGKGEFTMEYAQHMDVPPNVQKELIDEYRLGKK
ncbi:Elongation factor G-1, mitochondrial [Cymbomonas tetramitiformis]|uniref:Elongation factor G, mitochondrial n=1 Tax=Cymbomonas tetramitiformis TaxID=36881 RepID=A0AAE0BC50_9CHLO|nr:Elongation factor G-1, mitochondrial [Cymbomonas tetramitiformis]